MLYLEHVPVIYRYENAECVIHAPASVHIANIFSLQISFKYFLLITIYIVPATITAITIQLKLRINCCLNFISIKDGLNPRHSEPLLFHLNNPPASCSPVATQLFPYLLKYPHWISAAASVIYSFASVNIFFRHFFLSTRICLTICPSAIPATITRPFSFV